MICQKAFTITVIEPDPCADWSTLSPLIDLIPPFLGGIASEGTAGSGASQSCFAQVIGIGVAITDKQATLSHSSTELCNYNLHFECSFVGVNGQVTFGVYVDGNTVANGGSIAPAGLVQDAPFSVAAGPHTIDIRVTPQVTTNTRVDASFVVTTV